MREINEEWTDHQQEKYAGEQGADITLTNPDGSEVKEYIPVPAKEKWQWNIPLQVQKVKISKVISEEKCEYLLPVRMFLPNDVVTYHEDRGTEVTADEIFIVQEPVVMLEDEYVYRFDRAVPDAINKRLWRLASCKREDESVQANYHQVVEGSQWVESLEQILMQITSIKWRADSQQYDKGYYDEGGCITITSIQDDINYLKVAIENTIAKGMYIQQKGEL